MGILKSLFTLGKSFISQAEESIEENQGVRMLEQHIRDAKTELDKAGKSRVDLLARVKLSHDKLKDLRERKASLEARALEALSKNVNPSLINEVAEEIARLENLITAEEQVLSNLEVSRDGVEKAVTATAQRIAQFEQQMEVVKATEAMQRAQQAVTTLYCWRIFQRFDSGRILKTPANASGRTSGSPGCCRTVGKSRRRSRSR